MNPRHPPMFVPSLSARATGARLPVCQSGGQADAMRTNLNDALSQSEGLPTGYVSQSGAQNGFPLSFWLPIQPERGTLKRTHPKIEAVLRVNWVLPSGRSPSSFSLEADACLPSTQSVRTPQHPALPTRGCGNRRTLKPLVALQTGSTNAELARHIQLHCGEDAPFKC